jgi:hypothetical protein
MGEGHPKMAGKKEYSILQDKEGNPSMQDFQNIAVEPSSNLWASFGLSRDSIPSLRPSTPEPLPSPSPSLCLGQCPSSWNFLRLLRTVFSFWEFLVTPLFVTCFSLPYKPFSVPFLLPTGELQIQVKIHNCVAQ